MATTEQKLKIEIQSPVAHSGSKVTIVGVGQVGMLLVVLMLYITNWCSVIFQVGMACAFSIMTQVNTLLQFPSGQPHEK